MRKKRAATPPPAAAASEVDAARQLLEQLLAEQPNSEPASQKEQ
ncbi:MAG: hypothetical protein ABIR67_07090 [Gaiellaceae bacterium]